MKNAAGARRAAAKPPELSRRLSGVDAAFIYLEREEIPLHIAGVFVFDGEIPLREFVAAIDSKLHLIPRYRQVVAQPPFNLGPPTWEPYPQFDIHQHILPVRLDPPGGEPELEDLASRILSRRLDRGKPLWEIHVVEGMKNGRGALIARVHHALADGIAGAALMNIMFDPTPEGSHPIRKPRARAAAASPREPSLQDALRNAVENTLENLVAAEAGLLMLGQALSSGRMNQSIQRLLGILPEFAASIERLPFNKPCAGERKFRWAEMDLAAIQAIRALAGGTVNDVVLTIITRAIARYAIAHGETVVKRFLRVIVPVSLRREDERESLGNRITFMPVALPMDVADPLRHLQEVAVRTDIMKRARAADLVGLAALGIASTPPPLQSLFWAGISRITLPVPLFNIICTNVPGSPVPLYAVGRQMLTSYPHVPTGYDLGVNIAAQSYNGRLFFGLTADARATPDVDRLRDFLYRAFKELCVAAGVPKPQPAAAAAKARPEPRAESAPETVSAPRPAPVAGKKAAAKPKPQPDAVAEAAEAESTPVPGVPPLAPAPPEAVPVKPAAALPIAVGARSGQ